jgi:hypothetical protein
VLIDYILVNKYIQSEFNGTRFREIYVEMGMLFHIYYVTLSNPLLSSNTSQKLSFDKLLTSIDANFKYISPGFDFVQFDGDLLKIFIKHQVLAKFCGLRKLESNSCNDGCRCVAIGRNYLSMYINPNLSL